MSADWPQPPRKRPRILPGEEIDEKSKKVFQFIYIYLGAYCVTLSFTQFS